MPSVVPSLAPPVRRRTLLAPRQQRRPSAPGGDETDGGHIMYDVNDYDDNDDTDDDDEYTASHEIFRIP